MSLKENYKSVEKYWKGKIERDRNVKYVEYLTDIIIEQRENNLLNRINVNYVKDYLNGNLNGGVVDEKGYTVRKKQ